MRIIKEDYKKGICKVKSQKKGAKKTIKEKNKGEA